MAKKVKKKKAGRKLQGDEPKLRFSFRYWPKKLNKLKRKHRVTTDQALVEKLLDKELAA